MRLTLSVLAVVLGALGAVRAPAQPAPSVEAPSAVSGGSSQFDVDCAHARQAREQIGRTRLSEIEQAEDAGRAALGEALARCPPGEGGAACRAATREGFETGWMRRKVEIEARYRALLRAFDARCAGLLAGCSPP